MDWKGSTNKLKILAVDIGTGTMDVLLADTRLDVENSYKLILPSPTMQILRQIQQATRDRVDILLNGRLMGGGPSGWATDAHLKAGCRVFAIPEAARSFNDDLEKIREMGIAVVSEDEAAALPSTVQRIEMCDFDYASIAGVFTRFGVDLGNLAAVAVSVFDHGNAPASVSDRKFRFDYLDSRIRTSSHLSTFAFRSEEIPSIMTRLQAVADSAGDVPVPLVVMDSAPAAVLGAMFDHQVRGWDKKIMLNAGNLHTLAFRMNGEKIEGVFEHHTGFLDRGKLESLLARLAEGTITNEEIFKDHGHGALSYAPDAWSLTDGSTPLVVTGPRRSLLDGSAMHPYTAVPFGDMMTSGCVGLLAAAAELLPDIVGPVMQALNPTAERRLAPWDVD